MGDPAGTNPVVAIENLVERFERNIDAYRSGGYKDAHVRREFIDLDCWFSNIISG